MIKKIDLVILPSTQIHSPRGIQHSEPACRQAWFKIHLEFKIQNSKFNIASFRYE